MQVNQTTLSNSLTTLISSQKAALSVEVDVPPSTITGVHWSIIIIIIKNVAHVRRINNVFFFQLAVGHFIIFNIFVLSPSYASLPNTRKSVEKVADSFTL